MKRLQIYIDEPLDEALGRRARREGRSKAALIRDAVRREYAPAADVDAFDDWVGGLDEEAGEIDALLYER